MPTIDVSEKLYRQLQAEANTEDIDQTLWKMVGVYRREQNPQG
jgi:hypothetical protein